MNFLKKTLLLFTLVISFFLINANVKAYDIFNTTYKGMINEKDIYETFLTDVTFNPSSHKYIYCTASSQTSYYLYCFALTEDAKNNLVLNEEKINIIGFSGCEYYTFNISKTNSTYLRYNHNYCSSSISITYYPDYILSNFDFPFLSSSENKNINVLNFNFDEEESKELEITVTGTEILTSMLDKTKNIYEVLIANQLFVLCSCILLSYLVFIILYKTIRK